ncbi:MAG: YkgJ family cysteine cluster protein [Candidatus Electrothrix sp. GM3_4]|nr:YkgJ family cysteine cluster protein [Candidatus Electrothrix sp. GM3_4]
MGFTPLLMHSDTGRYQLKGNNLVNIEEFRAATEINLKNMTDSLPESIKKREDEFFLQIEKSELSHLKKLEKLYSFMDVLYKHVNKYTACKKGCSYCCYYYATISDIEMQFIEMKNKKIKRKEPFNTDNKEVGNPCLFLKNGGCSIYESRPYVCRRHVMLTPDNSFCIEDDAQKRTLQLLTWSKLDKSYDLIRAASGSGKLHDIRDVFEKIINIKG